MASTYLSRTLGTPTNAYKGTLSYWQKAASTTATNYILACESGNERMLFYLTQGKFQAGLRGTSSPPDIDFTISGTPRFRDVSAWYHVVLAWDSTQSTASDRMKLYVNNVQYTWTGSGTGGVNDIPQNHVMPMNKSGLPFRIGSTIIGGDYFEGIMSHIHFCDGTQYQASDFGEYDANGVWKIILEPSVTYGNNGFFILKDGNSVTDQSGNSNNLTVGGGTLTNTEDNPSNVFATWNPLQATTAATYDFVKGNTRVAANDVAQFSLGATLAAKTGKYYMEMIWVQHGGYDRFGMMPINANVSSTPHITGIGWDESAANLYMLGNVVSGSWGANMSTSDIIQIALDLDNGAFYLGVNGTWRNSGDPTSGASRTGAANFSATSLFGEDLTFAVGKGNAGTSGWNANFGNGYFETVPVSSAGTNASGIGIFEFDVPTGYTALSTKGLNL